MAEVGRLQALVDKFKTGAFAAGDLGAKAALLHLDKCIEEANTKITALETHNRSLTEWGTTLQGIATKAYPVYKKVVEFYGPDYAFAPPAQPFEKLQGVQTPTPLDPEVAKELASSDFVEAREDPGDSAHVRVDA